MQEVAAISSVDVRGKRVLLRTSLNVPISPEGAVLDTFRLKAAAHTITWLHEHGAKTIILAHLGRDGGSLRPVVENLKELLPEVPLSFSMALPGEGGTDLEYLKEGESVVLENIRHNRGEERNDVAFARQLSQLGDIYVNDAFADSHRSHASIVSLPALLPSYAGLLMTSEIAHLSKALTPPPHALAIVGGAKFETKEPLITKLLTQYEKILLGGALANDVLKARGAPIGASLVSNAPVPTPLAEDSHLIVPTDVLLEGKEGESSIREGRINDVRQDERIVDVGTETIQQWSENIVGTPFVIWNGPVGIYESGFIEGTDALAQALIHSSAGAVIGGGDILAAVQHLSFDPERIFLSTGGGAMLEFLTTGTLVGIEALRSVQHS